MKNIWKNVAFVTFYKTEIKMKSVLEKAAENQKKAWQIIYETDIINIWESIGAKVNLIGSLKTGLLMKNRDIDFHIYTDKLTPSKSFSAISKLAENPSIKRIQYVNLLNTDEKCIEWHAWYEDDEGKEWQIDMIHILKDSFYDGYFEKVAERISKVLTPEWKERILTIKNDTPETEKIPGIIYYMAVIRDNIQNYAEFSEWRKKHSNIGIIEWMP